MSKPSDRDCRPISDAFKAAMSGLERLSERPAILNNGKHQHQGSQVTNKSVGAGVRASLGKTIVEKS